MLEVRYGDWKLSAGDNLAWADATFDDSKWQHAVGGEDWRGYGDGSFNKTNATGWYRQHVTVPPNFFNTSSGNNNASMVVVTMSIGVVSGTNTV